MKLIYFYLGILLLSSCTPLMQKAYIVEPPDICNLDSAGDNRMNISGQYFTNTNVNFVHAVTEKYGYFVKGQFGYQGWFTRKDYTPIFPERNDLMVSSGAGLGAFYYRNKPNGNAFELLSGVGFQNNDSRLYGRMVTLPFVKYPMLFNQDVNCLFYKGFVQPNFIHRGQKSITSIAIRCELIYADSYYYGFRLSRAEPGHLINYIDDAVSFSNKFALGVSPFLIRQSTSNRHFWYWYFGMNLHTTMAKGSRFFYYTLASLKDKRIKNHPASALFTFGVALSFPLF